MDACAKNEITNTYDGFVNGSPLYPVYGKVVRSALGGMNSKGQ